MEGKDGQPQEGDMCLKLSGKKVSAAVGSKCKKYAPRGRQGI